MLPVYTTRVCISVAQVEQRKGVGGGGEGEEEGRGGRGSPWLLAGSLLIIKEFSKYS